MTPTAFGEGGIFFFVSVWVIGMITPAYQDCIDPSENDYPGLDLRKVRFPIPQTVSLLARGLGRY